MNKSNKKRGIPTQSGEMGLGTMVLIFMAALFILWVLSGGQHNETNNKPFIKPITEQGTPIQPYR
jgi:hypothetical protein